MRASEMPLSTNNNSVSIFGTLFLMRFHISLRHICGHVIMKKRNKRGRTIENINFTDLQFSLGRSDSYSTAIRGNSGCLTSDPHSDSSRNLFHIAAAVSSHTAVSGYDSDYAGEER